MGTRRVAEDADYVTIVISYPRNYLAVRLSLENIKVVEKEKLDGFDLPYLRFREATAVRPLTKNDRTLTLKRASNGTCWARYVVR
ncbi:hypothetical protein MTO96_012394 [Rhipicephalus appendiculatus]